MLFMFPVFEEPEDPSSRSFFSEIISSISDVKFSHSGRYMMTRDYLSVKVWDLNMENRPVETYQVTCSPLLINRLFPGGKCSYVFQCLCILRFTNIFEASFVHCMRMTASLTNLSAAGMVLIGKADLYCTHFTGLSDP